MEFEKQYVWKSVLNPTTSSGSKTQDGHNSSELPPNQEVNQPFSGSSKGSPENSVESEKLISSADSKSSLIQDGHDYQNWVRYKQEKVRASSNSQLR